MSDVASARFVQSFQQVLAKGGRVSEADLTTLKRAQGGIRSADQKAAAEQVMALLRHDRELDAFEVAPVKQALAVLTGATRLPKDLARVLKHAVPAANARVKEYDLSFDFSRATKSFPARAVVTLERKAGARTILEVDPARLKIGKVLADGKAVPFEVKDGRLHVEAKGARELTIDYRVTPQDVGRDASAAYGLIRDKYSGRMWTLTWPQNTGALFPSNSAPADGATSRVTVKVAAGHEALASGNPTGDGFASKKQAPAYAIALYTAPDFQKSPTGVSRDGVTVSGYGVYDAVPTHIRDAYRATAKDSLDFYSQWLGAYDYGDTLRLVEVSGGLGGMEHTSAVAIMLNAATDPDYSKETAAHEVAHHWFGDNVRIKNWGDFWMSEGFTNFVTYRYFRHAEGEPKYFALLDRARIELREALRENPHALVAPAHTDVHEIFDSVPYEMGPWMLRMMEVKLGQPTMDSLLRDWFQGHRQKEVSTDDFVRFAKAKTGEDFGPFFAAWNQITRVPELDGDVVLSGQKAAVSLRALGEVPAGVALPLRLYGDAGQTKDVTVLPGQQLTVDAGFTVKRFQWDPDRTVLADVR